MLYVSSRILLHTPKGESPLLFYRTVSSEDQFGGSAGGSEKSGRSPETRPCFSFPAMLRGLGKAAGLGKSRWAME